MYMVMDDTLNYMRAKYYKILTKFRHATFCEQSQNDSGTVERDAVLTWANTGTAIQLTGL
jgi:hypothetical protein